jgi:hypothetical protein
MKSVAAVGTLFMLAAIAGCSADATASPPPASSTTVHAGQPAPTFPAISCPAADWTCLTGLADKSGGQVLGPPRAANATITGPTLTTSGALNAPRAVTFLVSLPNGGTYAVGEVGINEKTGPVPIYRRNSVRVRGATGYLGLNLPQLASLRWYEHGRLTQITITNPAGNAAAVKQQLLHEATTFVWY